MGSCGFEQRPPLQKIDNFQGIYLHDGAVMCYPRSDRFGEIQTLKSTKDGIYRIIMAARLGKNTVKMQTVSVQCRIMSSLADFQLYDGANMTLQPKICPIIDLYDSENSQVFFHVTSEKKGALLAKIIRFQSYRDVKLKRGIYQVWLHQALDRRVLVDHFIMSRGTMNALVLVFKYFECSLLDLVQYRKQASEYGWTEMQVLFIWMKLLKGYRQLRQCNIFHRDLRLGNLYFTPANSAEPLQWANLSAARRMTTLELNEQDRELLTVRGVSCFAEGLKGHIEAGQELADYDPLKHDMACLERVMLAILNLDPYEQNRECKNEMLLPWLAKVRNATGTNELAEVEGAIEKILRAQQVNLNEMLLTDKEISEELSKKLLLRQHSNLIEQIYLKNLLLLHKRDIFNKFLLEKMEENERDDKKELNLDLLHQIGEYYESIGIADNDYYKQEITLVLDLAKEFRLEHFMLNHEQFIQKAMFLMEKYRYKGQDLRVRLKIEVVYSCLEAGEHSMANQQLTELLTIAHRQNALQLSIQAQALLVKAMVQTTTHNWQAAETTLQRASVIINEGRNFVTQLQHKRLKGDLLLLEGYHYLRYLKQERSTLPKPKYLGLAEESIGGALHTFLNLPQNPTNTVRIVDGYLLQAGLFIQLQKHAEAKKALDACNLLLEELSTKHRVAISLRLVVYEKLKVVTSPTDHSYPTVCRRLGQYREADLKTKDVHVRILNSLAQSRKDEKQIKRLEQSVIINEAAAELEHDKV